MRGPRLAARAVALLAGGAVLAGCAGSGGASSAPPVTVLRVGVPVHQPVWSEGGHALLALTDDARVARIEPDGAGTAATSLSAPLGDVGEDIAPDPVRPDVAYVPQPGSGRVTALDTGDLRPLGTLTLGPAPSYLTTDDGSRALLALSADRTTVSAMDLEGHTPIPPQAVHADPEAELDGPARGRLLEYHVVGPDGVVHYKGAPGEVEEKGRIDVRADKSAGDRIAVDRLYVAERDTDRLLAVATSPDHERLDLVAADHLGAPVRDVGTDETRIYAATDDALVVLETDTFTGYPDHHFDRVATIPFRGALTDDAARHASVAGLAVGPDRVYLTLEGQPAVVSIAKPPL